MMHLACGQLLGLVDMEAGLRCGRDAIVRLCEVVSFLAAQQHWRKA
jgi:hypothetical protein